MTTLAQISPLFINGGLAAAGAAAVVAPIAIHLLTRLRRRQQPWAAMRFLVEAYRRQRQRLRFEQWLLLLVRCLVLIVLGLALAGPLLGGLGRGLGVNASGRVVWLVVDDALSAQAQLGSANTRFDGLRRQAIRIVDGLAAADRVAILRVANPQRPELTPPTADHESVRRRLASMSPRGSAADWGGTLTSVGAALRREQVPADRAAVVLLSDFSAGSVEVDHPPGDQPQAADLGRRARLLATRPAPEAANVQIAALSPRRTMIVVEPAGRPTTVAVELMLHRFAAEQPDALTGVDAALFAQDADAPIATLHREHRWSAGQSVAVLNLEAPLPAAWLASSSAPRADGGVALTLRVRLDAGAGSDAIEADNQRFAVVEIRRRLAVGLIDEPAAPQGDQPWFLHPRDWLRLALAPQPHGGGAAQEFWPIEISDIAATVADEAALRPIDAAMVLRPDLLSTQGWRALRGLAQRGGLVWLFLPPASPPGVWAPALHEHLGLDWNLSLSPKLASNDDETAAWNLLADEQVPEPLGLLSGDWPALLRPIRVTRRVELTTRGGNDAVWLRVSDSAPGAPTPLLASASVGDGRVLLLATALDASWTNLMTKPLFVPLLHETLRGALGSAGEAARLSKLRCGEQPLLGRRWEGTQDLLGPGGEAIALRRSDQGLEPATPLEAPGVYTARPGAGLKLAVNVVAAAGNTQAVDPQALERWLHSLGDWSWIDPEHPELALLAETPRTDLGWPLLWATLALALLETALARRFSHAQQ